MNLYTMYLWFKGINIRFFLFTQDQRPVQLTITGEWSGKKTRESLFVSQI